MIDWIGTLVIGVIVTTLVVMAKTCGLSGRRGWTADESARRDATRGFRDPYR
jgi:hypothetical protein